jgi:hypothetical protein
LVLCGWWLVLAHQWALRERTWLLSCSQKLGAEQATELLWEEFLSPLVAGRPGSCFNVVRVLDVA